MQGWLDGYVIWLGAFALFAAKKKKKKKKIFASRLVHDFDLSFSSLQSVIVSGQSVIIKRRKLLAYNDDFYSYRDKCGLCPAQGQGQEALQA